MFTGATAKISGGREAEWATESLTSHMLRTPPHRRRSRSETAAAASSAWGVGGHPWTQQGFLSVMHQEQRHAPPHLQESLLLLPVHLLQGSEPGGVDLLQLLLLVGVPVLKPAGRS